MWNSLPPDIHGCLEFLQSLMSRKISSLSDHASTALATLDDLLEHYETLKLGTVDVVGKLGFPLLMSQLNYFFEYFIKSLVLVLLDDDKDVVKLILDGV